MNKYVKQGMKLRISIFTLRVKFLNRITYISENTINGRYQTKDGKLGQYTIPIKTKII